MYTPDIKDPHLMKLEKPKTELAMAKMA